MFFFKRFFCNFDDKIRIVSRLSNFKKRKSLCRQPFKKILIYFEIINVRKQFVSCYLTFKC